MRLNSLRTLYQEHQEKVSDKWDFYLSEYERLFAEYRMQAASILEIGVQNGGSLEIYARYFPHASHIVGCDVDPACAALSFADPRISVVIGDANAAETQQKVRDIAPGFDLIIDDGSHRSGDIIRSFAQYFSLLRDGGIYVVEDLHCSYWQDFEGGLHGFATSMAFFRRLTDIVNHQHWGIDAAKSAVLAGFADAYGVVFDEDLLGRIHSVEFLNSMCIVRKRASNLNALGIQHVAGHAEPVCEGRKALHGKTSTPPDQSKNPWLIPPEKQVADRDGHIALLSQVIKSCDERHAQLVHAIAERDEQLAQLSRSLTVMDSRVATLHRAVAEREEVIAGLFNSRSWKLTLPLRLMHRDYLRARQVYRFGMAACAALGGPLGLAQRLHVLIRKEGLASVVAKSKTLYGRYKEGGHAAACAPATSQEAAEVLDMRLVQAGPLISIVMPVYNTPVDMFREAIQSVCQQVYQNWELIVVDDNSTDQELLETIAAYAQKDRRIKTCFRTENGNIAAALNTGLEMVAGEFTAVLDHDDALDPAALYWIARALLDKPDADYVYTDEDKLSKSGSLCFGPFYKPGWSPEYLLGMMYTCHFGVYRTALVREVGGYRREFDGAQDYDFTLRFLQRTDKVIHVPRVLYHWRVWERSTAQSLDAKPLAQERARKALAEFLESQNENFVIRDGPQPGHHRVDFLAKGDPLVSIVIPTANGTIAVNGETERHIDAVVQSIFDRTRYKNYEVVVVHNGDLLAEQVERFSRHANLRLVHYDAPGFSLSQKINLGCKHAKGEYLVIMNDDIRVISEDWLDLMTGMVQRKGVGVVGPKLLFPDNTIQHAGVVLLSGLPGHAYYKQPKDADGYALGAKINRNYLAVTGACAITPKWLFDEVGGYSERYPLNYNDVDYCLKLHQLGYRSVYLANVEMYHYEGVSKAGGRTVAESEIEKFLEDWSAIYGNDPYYNPNLSQHAPYQFG